MLVISGMSINLNRKEYVAIDNASGGYLYWSPRLFSAKEFSNINEALSFLENPEFTKISKMASGEIYPPHMLQGVKIDNIKIEEINLTGIKTVDFSFVKAEYWEIKNKVDKLIEELKTS